MNRRFSLSSLLVTLTLVALGVTCLALNLRLRRLDGQFVEITARSRKLEAQLGIVAAGDPARVQVLSVSPIESLHWKWRVRLPKDADYRVSVRHGDVGEDEFKERDGIIRLARRPEDDEITEIELTVLRERDGVWSRSLRIDGRRMTTEVPPAMQSWLADNGRYLTEIAGANGTQEFSDEQPIVLLRTREAPPRDPMSAVIEDQEWSVAGPTKYGLRLWLELDHVER